MLPCLFLAYGVIGWADIVASKLRRRRMGNAPHCVVHMYSIAARFDTKDNEVS
jgi:hypothetical protein